ncbi:MAG: glycosidase, partial [Gemmiger qucibialis]
MKLDISPMLNAYPDSMGGTLHDIVQLLARPEFENVFGSFYILPSVFNTDLDRGFSVIDYTLNRELAGPQDMEGLKALGLKLKLDFILNHASVLSPQFQDLLKNGKSSAYRDFFIDWNDFWQGCGSMTEQGYIQPEAKYLEKMLFRKPGLPILMARMPDGTEEPYWNTFYQQVDYLRPTVQQLMQISGLQYSAAVRLHSMLTAALNAGQKPDEINFGKYAACKSVVINWLEEHREYLGQMDLNIKS